MNLPFFKKKASHQQVKREYFLALELSDTVVSSACWAVVNNKPQVLSVGKASSWDAKSEESLVTACDVSTSDAAIQLDPAGNIEPQKVVLGLPPHWIVSDKIVPEKARLLKGMTQKLSLEAMGFVVTPEAVVRYLQISEGVPPTAILLGFSTTDVCVTLVRLGKTDGMETVVRSDSVAADVAEGLARLKNVDILPSRMMLYGSDQNLETSKQQLLAYPWQSPHAHLKFLHLPKVESLPANFSLHALAIASGSEMVGSIVPNIEPDIVPTVTTTPPVQSEDSVPTTIIPEVDPQEFLDNPHISTPAQVPRAMSPQALGFLIEEAETAEPEQLHIPKQTAPRRLPKLPLPRLALPRPAGLVGLVVGVLALGGILTAAYWFLPTATVNISVEAKTISQGFDVTTDTAITSADSESRKIPAQQIETTVSDEKTAPATGSKLVGDKATGKVTLLSGLKQKKVVPAGTVLVGPNGLKFTLDANVEIASASGASSLIVNDFKPGEATANVTASQIGTDSNLTAGNQFQVSSFSPDVMIAKNTEAFSGGNSRQAKVVSSSDIAKLRTELVASLKEKATSELSGKVTDDLVLLTNTIEVKTVSEDVNHKIDAVADSVTMKLSVRSLGLAYAQSDINELASAAVLKDLPQKYSPSGKIEPQIALKSQDKNGSVLGVQIEATALPQIDVDEVKRQLMGKSVSDATSYVTGLPGVSNVEVIFSVPLPKILRILPHKEKNINVEVKTQ